MPLSANLLNDFLIELLVAALAAFGSDTRFELRRIAGRHTRNAEGNDRDEKQGRQKKEDAPDDVLKQGLGAC